MDTSSLKVDARYSALSCELENHRLALNETSAILRTSPDGTIYEVNDAFCRLSGWRRDEILGQNCRVLKSGHHPQAFYEKLWRTVLSGEVWKGEIQNKDKSGRLYWVYSTILPFRNRQGEVDCFFCMSTDIGDRKAIERALSDLRDLAAARPSQIDLLVGVAHEINNPLATATCRLEHLRDVLSQATMDLQARQESLLILTKVEPTLGRLAEVVRGLRRIGEKRAV